MKTNTKWIITAVLAGVLAASGWFIADYDSYDPAVMLDPAYVNVTGGSQQLPDELHLTSFSVASEPAGMEAGPHLGQR